MNRSKLLVSSIRGAAILSFAQFAFGTPSQTRVYHTATMDHAAVA